jgi:hypothetical protein
MFHLEKFEAWMLRTTGTCVFTLATLTAREADEAAGTTVVESWPEVMASLADMVWPDEVMVAAAGWEVGGSLGQIEKADTI